MRYTVKRLVGVEDIFDCHGRIAASLHDHSLLPLLADAMQRERHTLVREPGGEYLAGGPPEPTQKETP